MTVAVLEKKSEDSQVLLHRIWRGGGRGELLKSLK
jgi:hypothetical protein